MMIWSRFVNLSVCHIIFVSYWQQVTVDVIYFCHSFAFKVQSNEWAVGKQKVNDMNKNLSPIEKTKGEIMIIALNRCLNWYTWILLELEFIWISSRVPLIWNEFALPNHSTRIQFHNQKQIQNNHNRSTHLASHFHLHRAQYRANEAPQIAVANHKQMIE